MPAVKSTDGHLRDVYAAFFKNFYKLPDEIGRMKLSAVFALLDGLSDAEPSEAEIPPHLRAFYGLD